MKKWLLVPAFIIIAALAGIYLFIPARLDIVQSTPINCSIPGAYRNMATEEKWKNWWPGSSWHSNSFLFQDGSYVITKKLLNTLEIGIHYNKLAIPLINIVMDKNGRLNDGCLKEIDEQLNDFIYF